MDYQYERADVQQAYILGAHYSHMHRSPYTSIMLERGACATVCPMPPTRLPAQTFLFCLMVLDSYALQTIQALCTEQKFANLIKAKTATLDSLGSFQLQDVCAIIRMCQQMLVQSVWLSKQTHTELHGPVVQIVKYCL